MSLLKDVRYGARMLGRSPIFTAVAVLSLALGIGAGTSIFSLVNAILLRSLPVPNPHELRLIKWSGADWENWEDHMGRMNGVDNANRFLGDSISVRALLALQEQCASQAEIFGYSHVFDCTLRARREAVMAKGMFVSDNFFSGLGVRPLIGRLLVAEDDRAGAAPAVVISHRLWEQQFGLDPGALGQAVTLRTFTFTVVGVLPREFPGVEPGAGADFYVCLSAKPQLLKIMWTDAEVWWVRPMARLKPGVSDAQFQAAVSVLFWREAEGIKMKDPKLWITAGHAGPADYSNMYEGSLRLLLCVVGVVLLVACANLAGLMVARGAARRHEFAVRAALGAGRSRLLRQSLTESMLLAWLGGGLGLVIAIWGKTVVGRLLADSPEGLHYGTSLDLRVLSFTLAISLATALLSGLLPALRAANVDASAGLKDRGALGALRLGVGRFLVTAQITLSLLLVCVGGLFVRTLVNLTNIKTGYPMDHLLVFQLRPDNAGYERAQAFAFFDRVLASLNTIPGVRSASLATHPPLSSGSNARYKIPGEAPGSGFTESSWTMGTWVSESFFTTIGIPLALGRELRATDDSREPKVVVVNEKFAREYLPGRNPIGVTIMDQQGVGWQIVGVCRDVKYLINIRFDVVPMAFFSFRQRPPLIASFVLRTALPPLSVAVAARRAVVAIDPKIPVHNLSTLEQARDATIWDQRTFAMLSGSLAALAVLLSCLGLYGLMAYQVARRTGEIGIRQALGATRWQIAGPILREAFVLAGIGIVIGMPLTLALARGIRSTLYGVGTADPVTFCGAAILFLAVALIAAWIPARRAARVDPMVALRNE